MRNLIYAINVTVDGCCDHTKLVGSEEILEHYTQLLGEVDLFVYGRKTYELMVPYWPNAAKDPSGNKASLDYGRAFAAKQKVVFSRSLERVEDEMSRVARGNLGDEILKLKQEDGRSILAGGVDLPSQLIELGLVDELRIVVQPFVVGEGRRLFDRVSLTERLRWKLADSKVFDSGSVALRYVK